MFIVLPTLSFSSRSSLPGEIIISLAMSKTLLALGLHVSRDWILAQGMSLWSLVAVTLCLGAAGLTVWEQVGDGRRIGRTKRKEVS